MFRTLLLSGCILMLLAGCQTQMNKKATIDIPPTQLPSLAKAAKGETHIVKLKNGLTVLIKEDNRFPLVNVRLYVHAGSAYETPKLAGISHLLEHMVFKGTEKRGPGETAREIESVGGSMNAATSFDYTVYYVEVPEDKWSLGLDVVTDMAFKSIIDPTELESEKKVVLEELERGEEGLITARAFGGTAKWRTCYTSDGTGHAVMCTMDNRCAEVGVEVHDKTEAIAMIQDGDTCYGVVARCLRTGELTTYLSKATMIASGGFGRIYPNTTNAVICDGGAHTMCVETGVVPMGNMEAVSPS